MNTVCTTSRTTHEPFAASLRRQIPRARSQARIPFDRAFERHRTGHDQDLAKQIKKPVRGLDTDVTTDPGHDQVHRKVRNERPRDLIIGMGLGGAVAGKHEHPREMIVVVHHRRRKARPKNRHHRRRKQQRKNDNGAAPLP